MRSIIYILQNNAALTNLLGGATKIGMNTIGQTTKTPYVVVDVEDRTTTNTFDSDGGLDFVRITVSCVADLSFTSGSVVGADEIGNAVRTAINYVAAGTYDGEVLNRCTLERSLSMQENRTANKPSVTREDEYLAIIQP